MAEGLLCDVCRQGREAKRYVIVIKKQDDDTPWSEKVIDRCPKCLERLHNQISVGKI